MTERLSGHALRAELDLPYAQAVERVVAGLRSEGFGVLTEIDVQATLKRKLGVDFRKYVILGACNPPLAHQALSTELELGLLLPCNAIVYERDGGGSVVSIVDPISMLGVAESVDLAPVAEEARRRLQRVIEALSSALWAVGQPWAGRHPTGRVDCELARPLGCSEDSCWSVLSVVDRPHLWRGQEVM